MEKRNDTSIYMLHKLVQAGPSLLSMPSQRQISENSMAMNMTKNEIPAIREATGAFCRSILDAILPAVRVAAQHKGYAIAVHGSLKRDIDLIAIAWTEHAASHEELVHAVVGAVTGILGNCLTPGGGKAKPHGRVAYTLIHPGFAGEIDLSVIPPRSDGQGGDPK